MRLHPLRTPHALLLVALVVAVWSTAVLRLAGASTAANPAPPPAAPAVTGPLPTIGWFTDDVPFADRAAVVASLRLARPEARALIARVSTGVVVAPMTGTDWHDGYAFGPTARDRRWHIELRLASLRQMDDGHRAFVVVHEFAHVVDGSVLPARIRRRLDDGIPRDDAWCRREHEHTFFACAPRNERFADTFAKWALGGDPSAPGSTGYHVPEPASLEAWGAPLAALATTG